MTVNQLYNKRTVVPYAVTFFTPNDLNVQSVFICKTIEFVEHYQFPSSNALQYAKPSFVCRYLFPLLCTKVNQFCRINSKKKEADCLIINF